MLVLKHTEWEKTYNSFHVATFDKITHKISHVTTSRKINNCPLIHHSSLIEFLQNDTEFPVVGKRKKLLWGKKIVIKMTLLLKFHLPFLGIKSSPLPTFNCRKKMYGRHGIMNKQSISTSRTKTIGASKPLVLAAHDHPPV